MIQQLYAYLISKFRELLVKYRKNDKIGLNIYIDFILSKFLKNLYYFFFRNVFINRTKPNYIHAKNIFDYIKNKEIDIKRIYRCLDIRSRYEAILFLNRLNKYLDSKPIKKGELVNYKEFSERDKILKCIIKEMKEIYYPISKFDTSVFYSHCGLKYLPLQIVEKLRNKDFIDGGAYIGDSSLIFEKYYEPKAIYAIEPEKRNYTIMLKTMELNNLNKVFPINKALGENLNSLKFISQFSGSRISEEGNKEVQVITIEKLVEEYNLDVGLIKLDVEGWAKYVLKGAINIIKEKTPVLLIGIYHNGIEFFEIVDFILKINKNYKIIIRKIDPLDGIQELMLIAWNVNS